MQDVGWMHAFLDVPGDRVDAARAFWAAVTGWVPTEPWPEHPEFESLAPPDGTAYLHVQVVDGPPRVHLDVTGDLGGDATRLERLGAVRGQRHDWW